MTTQAPTVHAAKARGAVITAIAAAVALLRLGLAYLRKRAIGGAHRA